MRLIGTDDPARWGQTEDEVRVSREDAQGAVDFAAELAKETNAKIRRLWERDYYRDIRERYSPQIAAAMLKAVWDGLKGEPDALSR